MTRQALTGDARGGLLDVLRKILQSIGSARDEREIFEIVVREGARRLPYDWLSVVLEDPDRRAARVFLSSPGGAGALRVGETVKPPSGFWEVMQSGRPFVRPSLGSGGPLWEDAGLRDVGVVAYAVVPMSRQGRVVGALGFGTRGATDVAGHVETMTRLATFVAGAAFTTRQVEGLQRGLTRLREKAAIPIPPDV